MVLAPSLGLLANQHPRLAQLGPTTLNDAQEAFEELAAGALPSSIAHLAHLFDAGYISASIQTALDILKKISVRSNGSDKTVVYVHIPTTTYIQLCA